MVELPKELVLLLVARGLLVFHVLLDLYYRHFSLQVHQIPLKGHLWEHLGQLISRHLHMFFVVLGF